MVTDPSTGGDHDERPRSPLALVKRAGQQVRAIGPTRSVRLGVVGLAALAVLSSAALASPTQMAVPAEGVQTTITPNSTPSSTPSSAATSTYDLRSERIDRTDRSTTRPSAPATSASAKKKSPATKMTAVPKKVTPKAAATKSTATKSTATPSAKAVVPQSVGTRYTRVDLNVRTEPSDRAKLVDVIDSGSKIMIATQTSGLWQSVVHDGALGWVKAQYLAITKPVRSTSPTSPSSSSAAGSTGGSTPPGGVSGSACASGSSVETGGLTRDAVAVHRAVCAQFPQITSYGGVRADSLPEHPSGRALDCMLPSYSSAAGNALGWQIANWLKANAGRLGISQILFDQHIWTVQRGGEGWRSMSNRGGDTANHRDHVHVTVYGNAS